MQEPIKQPVMEETFKRIVRAYGRSYSITIPVYLIQTKKIVLGKEYQFKVTALEDKEEEQEEQDSNK